jgi:hypothetical protein
MSIDVLLVKLLEIDEWVWYIGDVREWRYFFRWGM